MKTGVLEGLLFVVGEDGLDIKQVEEILDVDYEEAKEIIKNLCDMYKQENRGLQLVIYGNRLKLTTKVEHKMYYEKLVDTSDSVLSQAALETLAIIAYNNPITRVEIDEIRGVSSSHMVRKLISKNLVKEVGKSDLPGRPLLYGVTDEFLDHFGLSSTDELPVLKEIEVPEEEDLYQTRYQEAE
jgi:segregation and condensation protein B